MDLSVKELLKAPVLNDAVLWTGDACTDSRVKHLGILVARDGFAYLPEESAVILSALQWREDDLSSTLLALFCEKKTRLVILRTSDDLREAPGGLAALYARNGIAVAAVSGGHNYSEIINFFENHLYLPADRRYISRDELYGQFLKCIGTDGLGKLTARASRLTGLPVRLWRGGEVHETDPDGLLQQWAQAPYLEGRLPGPAHGRQYQCRVTCKRVDEQDVFALEKGLKFHYTLWMLKPGTVFSAAEAEVFSYAAKACEIQGEVYEKEQTERQKRNEVLFRQLVGSHFKPDKGTPLDLQAAGWHIGAQNQVCVLEAGDSALQASALYAALRELLDSRNLPCQIPYGVVNHHFCCIFPDAPAGIVRAVLAEAMARAGISGCRAGVGSRVNEQSLHIGYEEAKHALGYACLQNKDLVFYSEIGFYRLLLHTPQPEREAFCADALRPLVELDETSKSELLPTLDAFLQNFGNYAQTAAQIHMHINSVRYRIQNIETLLGVDFKDAGTFLDFYLAFYIKKMFP